MQTDAILLSAPRQLGVAQVGLKDPSPQDVVVRVSHSGVSTGTEKLFWTGEMPPFPGMGYPLIPGYEAVGEVVEAGAETGFKSGETVFVPGANCFTENDAGPVYGLFGAASQTLVSDASRVVRVDAGLQAEGALLALAATAYHAVRRGEALPELIVGHGVLGRLMARITLALGGPAPTVWEVNPARATCAEGYDVVTPEDDPKKDYRSIMDASGAPDLINSLIARLTKGGEVVMAGFYTTDLSFGFIPAFMCEARLTIAAEWTPADLEATRALIESGDLSLGGLITHRAAPADAPQAYETAFTDPDCLKMIFDWRTTQ